MIDRRWDELEETLAALFLEVQHAAADLAGKQGWSGETRLKSAAQVFGVLAKRLLDECRARGVPTPPLEQYAWMSLELAERPMLSTADALFAHVHANGASPGESDLLPGRR